MLTNQPYIPCGEVSKSFDSLIGVFVFLLLNFESSILFWIKVLFLDKFCLQKLRD